MSPSELGRSARALASLADYQSGAIVSRTLIGKSAGTATLFAFDAGQGLSEHSAPYDALVLVVEGGLEVSIGGEPQTLVIGDVLLLPANEPHAVHAQEPGKMLLVMIRE